MWLKDANCINSNYPKFDNDDVSGDGQVSWQHALDFIAGINNEIYLNCGAGYIDWQLPNRRSLESLSDLGQYGPALSIGHPFQGVRGADDYWTSTTYEPRPGQAWYIEMYNGLVGADSKIVDKYVWPVRGAP
jgi:hypothetical protein